MRRFVLFATLSLVSSTAFAAHPRIDQEQPAVNNTGAAIQFGSISSPIGTTGTRLAQVFAAALNGTLTHVTLPLACEAGAKVKVSIHSVSGGLPSAPIAGEGITGATYPQYVAPYYTVPAAGFRLVQFSNPASVTAGTQYAIVLSALGKCSVLPGLDGDHYAGGRAYYDSTTSRIPGWHPLGPPMDDLPFQTFIDTDGVEIIP